MKSFKQTPCSLKRFIRKFFSSSDVLVSGDRPSTGIGFNSIRHRVVSINFSLCIVSIVQVCGAMEWIVLLTKQFCVVFKAGAPLIWVFWSFLTFLHHGIDEVERYFLWKFHKKFKKGWSNVPPKLLACIGFNTKLCTKSAVFKSSIALGRLYLTLLPLGLSLWNLAHLFIMFMATKRCLGASDVFIFVWGLSYDLSKSKMR